MSLDWEGIKTAEESSAKIKHKDKNVGEKSKIEEKESRLLDSQMKHKEQNTRTSVTLCFLVGLFILIGVGALYVVYYNNNIVSLAIVAKSHGIELDPSSFTFLSFESIFSLIFNALGTPLGFIIGYYFKAK